MLHISAVTAQAVGVVGVVLLLSSRWLPTRVRRVVQRRRYAAVMLVVLMYGYLGSYFAK
ncbi:hypothetical protein KDL01_06715 [Actinospica durhamensis]|uniref:Uncharacterized protein n=1 Tax=Actinospica durhamensis TaxID=1508375 RepID=A0A941IS72_9ACTN|nr:hypothetical protein [Actinospica durhamensis]MBR7832946.1 hypothetical protein [Actinospica durhamensis]